MSSDTERRPIGGDLLVTQQVNIEATITTSDITDVLVSETEENLLLEKDILKGNLNGAHRKHKKLETKLGDQAQALISKQTDPAAKKAAAALKAFDGKTYHVYPTNGKADVEGRKITVDVVVSAHTKPNEAHYSYNNVASKQYVIEFTTAMVATCEQLAKAAEEIANVEADLQGIQRKLADLPRMARRAKASIVRAQLEGHLVTGQDILDRMDGVKPLALPGKSE